MNMCVQAEQQLQKKSKGQLGEMLEKAAEQLMSCFRICASDKSVHTWILRIYTINTNSIHFYLYNIYKQQYDCCDTSVEWIFAPIVSLQSVSDVKADLTFCSRAGIEDSKKWGMMFLSNQLFKIYFKVWMQCQLIYYWLQLIYECRSSAVAILGPKHNISQF